MGRLSQQRIQNINAPTRHRLHDIVAHTIETLRRSQGCALSSYHQWLRSWKWKVHVTQDVACDAMCHVQRGKTNAQVTKRGSHVGHGPTVMSKVCRNTGAIVESQNWYLKTKGTNETTQCRQRRVATLVPKNPRIEWTRSALVFEVPALVLAHCDNLWKTNEVYDFLMFY